jgi:uncharacterized protein (TIGR02300 family)
MVSQASLRPCSFLKRGLLLTALPAHGKGAGFNSNRSKRRSPLANPELGAKQICPNCQAKFYDLTRRPAVCPKCGTEFDPDEAVRTRRARTRTSVADHEHEEAEDQVRGKAKDEDEEDEDEAVTPELDEVVDEPPLVSDDDDEAADATPEDQLSEFTEDDLEDEETDDVPFLEDEDEDDFDDAEIEGLPGEGDDDDR